MKRTVAAQLELEASGAVQLILSVAVAVDQVDSGCSVTESLRIVQDGVALTPVELLDEAGTRLHQVQVQAGAVEVSYTASVLGEAAPAACSEIDRIRYLRPSRYCESDRLGPTAHAEFAGLTGTALLNGVSSWVGQKLRYVPGASLPTDGAVRTLLAREGVCRDYAHLVVALLRALDVPARLVSVYAPGLTPMDFHAVAEAWVDEAWQVVDATTLAPRQSLLRIATGRDAADIAFLTSIGAPVTLHAMSVSAVADVLPRDDVRELVQLR